MAETLACPGCGGRLVAGSSPNSCPNCRNASATAAFPPAHAPSAEAVGRTPTLEQFCRTLRELDLIRSDELEPFLAEAGNDVLALSKALARAGKLTSYQAGVLAQGRARGLVIGPYLVLKKRGQGGMGVVFKAKHRSTGRVVALKILLPSFGRDRDAVRRFRREFEVAARLDHPHIVAALEADEDRGVQYLTMEYVEGNDLDDLVRSVGPLPVKLSIHCVIQAARGMAAAHAQGIVHRDLKPANLMLDATGLVRVLDLGLARVIESANPMSRDSNGALTQTGSYMGTVDFVAPEQADDSKNADHRADVYSLGCTLFFLLAGRPPFEADTILKRLMAHQQQPAPTLHSVRGDIPEALEAAYQAMMAKKPGLRTRSMDEVIAQLEACCASADEAKEARAGLRSFAETAMKRASPRKRGWGIDASVFARRTDQAASEVDSSLRLEDLVTDYRDEVKPRELDESDLPPLLPRIAAPRRRTPSQPLGPMIGLAAGAVLIVAAFLYLPRVWRGSKVPVRSESSIPVARAEPVFTQARSLFGPGGLDGWFTHDGSLEDWEFKDGVLASRPHTHKASFLATEALYSDFRLRLEFQPSAGSNGGLMLMGIGPDENAPSCVELIDIVEGRTRNTFLWGDGSPFRTITNKPVELAGGGAWETLEVERRNGLIHLTVNGQTVLDGFAEATDPRRIGFQNYPGPGAVRYRNVLIEDLSSPLPAPGADGWISLFDGNSLAGWVGAVNVHGVSNGLLSCRPDQKGAIYSPHLFNDFVARVEFRMSSGGNSGLAIHYPGTGIASASGLCEIQILDERSPKYAGIDSRRTHGSAYGLVAASRRSLRPDGEWNVQEVTVRGTRVKVESNGVEVLDADMASVLESYKNISHPGKNRQSGFFGLCHTPGGLVEFRKVEIKELTGSASDSSLSSHGLAKPEPNPALLFVDDFDKPREDWNSATSADLAKNPNDRWGYRDGVHYHEAREWSDLRTFLPPRSLSDFSFEVVGRVTGDKPTSRGSLVLHVDNGDRSIQIRIDGNGNLFLEPTHSPDIRHRESPWLGPIRHPAIIQGAAGYNKVRLVVRKRRLEIFVNSVRVCDPLDFGWDLTPARVALGVDCWNPTVRAEYDRVEIRSLTKEDKTRSPAPIKFLGGGSRIEADGTHWYEAAYLKVAKQTGGSADRQVDMAYKFEDRWVNDRHLLWDSPKPGNVLTLDLPVETSGLTRIEGHFTLASAYGRVKLTLDGQPLFGDQPLDLYSPRVQPSQPIRLGTIPLSPGRKQFTVTVVGKQPASTGFSFGLDEIRLIPAH